MDKRKLFSLLAILMLGIVLMWGVGCDLLEDDTDDPDSTTGIPAGLVGAWSLQYWVEDNSVEMAQAGMIRLVINEDGSWQYIANNAVRQSGSATVEVRSGVEHVITVVTWSEDAEDIGDSNDLTVRRGSTWLTFDYTMDGESSHEVYTRNHSGNNAVNGVLFNTTTMAPMAALTVTATPSGGSPITTTTDAFGFYRFENLSAGVVTLTAGATGFADWSQPVSALQNVTLFFGSGMTPMSSDMATITGRVNISMSNDPIVGASIVSNDGANTTTNSEGRYTLIVTPGSRTITASATGYTSQAQSVTIAAGQSTTMNFFLSEGSSETATVSGTVKDLYTTQPLEFALVTAATGEFDYTNEDGFYFMTVPAGTINLTATFDGYLPGTHETILLAGQSEVLDFLLYPDGGSGGSATVQGYVTHSQTGDPLEGVLIATSGSQSTTSDDEGFYSLTLSSGTVVLTASLYGYYDNIQQVTLSEDETRDLNFVLSPTLSGSEGQLRFVLSWGASPSDLDSYLETPEIEGNTYTICYWMDGDSLYAPYATLDRDDVDSYGPETITIYTLFDGTYNYYVHNYSGWPELAGCGALVQIYDDEGLIQSVTVPTTGSGTYWHVVDVDGATGNLTLINQIQTNPPGNGKMAKRNK